MITSLAIIDTDIRLAQILFIKYTISKKIRVSNFQIYCKGDTDMLAELRQKSQITIPKEIIVKLGLSEGDTLDIFEKDGTICIMSVVVYPKNT